MPEIDDRFTIAPPLRLSRAQRVLAAEKRAVEIDRQHPAPGRVVGVLDGAEQRDAGGIDQPVEPPMRAVDRGQHALPVVLGGDVEHMIDAGLPGEIGRDRDRRPRA